MALTTPDAIATVRKSFIIPAGTILLVRALPALSARFLAYGSRTAAPATTAAAGKGSSSAPPAARLLDALAAPTVPHSWFASFYGASLGSSAFWAAQALSRGRVLAWIGARAGHGGMRKEQVLVVWGMMLVQASRRLAECRVLGKESRARMHVGHWALGVGFYLLAGVAVWVEGAAALVKDPVVLGDFWIKGIGLRTFVAVSLFMFASGVQHDCHAYLASLKKYTVPQHPLFKQLVCPHYFAECLIYLALAIQAAPKGHMVNRTMMCALVFVAVNLGVTADGTKKWYEEKFGAASVQGRWRMIPFLF